MHRQFAVLVHDTFLWGSRKFPLQEMETALNGRVTPDQTRWQQEAYGMPEEVAAYNHVAGQHEHVVSKYLNLLGTGLPGVVMKASAPSVKFTLHVPPISS